MATVEITMDNFVETINSNDTVLLDFWAEWCGPCRQFSPIFEKAAEANDNIVFGKVNTDDQQELSAAMGISSIPTLIAFRGGVMVFNQAGVLPGPALDSLISQVLELDVDEVRRMAQEQQAAVEEEKAAEESRQFQKSVQRTAAHLDELNRA